MRSENNIHAFIIMLNSSLVCGMRKRGCEGVREDYWEFFILSISTLERLLEPFI